MQSTLARSTRTAAAVCLGSAVLLIVTAAIFRWSGQPTVVGIGVGIGLLVLALMWRASDEVPRFLPSVTTMAGIVLVVAPLVLDYDDGDSGGDEAIGVAYATHIVVGLVLAATGFWSGKRMGVPRVDKQV